MGAIAVAAQDPAAAERSLHLFRTVIVASASVSGYFPPVVISAGDQPEVHVDGAVNAPLMLLPKSVAMSDIRGRLRLVQLVAVVNRQIDSARQRLRCGTFTVIGSAVSSMNRTAIRSQLQLLGLFARQHGAIFSFAAVPDNVNLSPLQFDPVRLR